MWWFDQLSFDDREWVSELGCMGSIHAWLYLGFSNCTNFNVDFDVGDEGRKGGWEVSKNNIIVFRASIVDEYLEGMWVQLESHPMSFVYY